MKILKIAPTPYFSDRGTHIRLFEEARGLSQLGHKIRIVTYHIGKNVHKKYATKVEMKRILPIFFWYKKFEAGASWQKLFLDFQLLIKTIIETIRFNPEILHCHLHEGILIGFIAKKILFWKKLKIVGDLHGTLVNEMTSCGYLKKQIIKRFFTKLETFINSKPDIVITSSKDNLNYIKNKKSIFVPDGIDLNRFKKDFNKSEIKQKYSLPNDKRLVVYTGAFHKNKGIDTLLSIIKSNQSPNTHFVLAGSPIEKIQNDVNKLQNVTLIPNIKYNDIPELLSACELTIDPKRGETMQGSGKILQYIGSDLPIFCFDTVNNRQMLGDNYLFCKNENLNSIINHLSLLLSSHQVLTELKEKIQQRKQLFDITIPISMIDKIYQRLKQ